jgi:hypothetical protein
MLAKCMDLNRKLVLAATVAAFAIAPLTLAGAADAATSSSYSVSVLHCGGGIHAKAYHSHAKALKANHKAVAFQRHHPATLHSVQLRHGSKVVKSSTRSC